MTVQGSPGRALRAHEQNTSNAERAPGVDGKRTRQDREVDEDGEDELESPLPSASSFDFVDSEGFESGLVSDRNCTGFQVSL